MIHKLRPMHRYMALVLAIGMAGFLVGCPEVPFPTTSGPLASVAVSTDSVVIDSSSPQGTVYVYNGGAPLNALLWTASSPQPWITVTPPTGLSYGPADGDRVAISASGGGRDLLPGVPLSGEVLFTPVGALSPPVSVSVDAASDGSIFAGVNVGRGVVGDFNGDGAFDFASLNVDQKGIDVFITPTAKGIAGDQFIEVPLTRLDLAHLVYSDLNFDGIGDLATVSVEREEVDEVLTNRSYLNIAPGSPSGVFGSPIRLSMQNAGEQIFSFAVADFDVDGRNDVIGGTALGLATVLELSAAGGVPDEAGSGFFIGAASYIAAADLVGDSRPDVVVAAIAGNINIIETIDPDPEDVEDEEEEEEESKGSSGFDNALIINIGVTTQFGGLGVPDLTGDGLRDVVVVSPRGVTSILNLGDGEFGSPVSTPTCATPLSMALGDFTGDGVMDIAVGCALGIVEIMVGQGNGQFTAGQTVVFGFPVEIVRSMDWNGDGIVDLIGGDAAGMMAVAFGDGAGNFS